MALRLLLVALALPWLPLPRLEALESEAVERPGVKSVRLLTDISAIVPGEPFTVALRLEPMPDHHTYWRGPGIVGVATRIDWTLPEGFRAGEILWPPPQSVRMAGILANGYKTPTLLLVEITPPEHSTADRVTLSARCSWMACAVSCNPGTADLQLELPVARPGETPPRDAALSAAFASAREQAPKPAPAAWTFQPRLPAADRIQIDLVVPGLSPDAAESLHFFCDDMQIDSDESQRIEIVDAAAGAVRISLYRPEFAPKSPDRLSGVIRCPGGWPGLEAEFVEFSAPWPEGTFSK